MKKARARRMTGHCVLTETDSTFTDSKVEIPCTGEVISGKMTDWDIIAVEGTPYAIDGLVIFRNENL